ncbi:MAG: phenylacetaldoxime dehydratase family protein [Pseudomonadota bacterium]
MPAFEHHRDDSSVSSGRRCMAKGLPPTEKKDDLGYVAYVVDFQDTDYFINAYIGIECDSRDEDAVALAADRRAAIIDLLEGENAPDVVEFSVQEEIAPRQGDVIHLYWKSVQTFETWSASDALKSWFSSVSGTGVSLWMESAKILSDQVETSGSHPTDTGMGRLVGGHRATDVMGYWGGMYDRVAAYKTRDMSNPEGPHPKAATPPKGDIVHAVMPHNVCLTNGNANWGAAEPDERAFYLKQLHPALQNAHKYLRDEPDVANAYSSRFLRMTDLDGNAQDRICMLVYFVSLDDLHAWTGKHETHQRIFHLYQAIAKKIQRAPSYELWHEVSVVPGGGLWGLYANCPDQTGFKSYATQYCR